MRPPYGFSWVIPDLIAAMGRPRELHEEMPYLKKQKIDMIISLTRAPLARSFVDEFGFDYLHLPMRDFSAPTQRQIDRFVNAIKKCSDENKKVAIHCQAGMGRTGTMISCFLVNRGMDAREAINQVRKLRPGSVETYEQEMAVLDYEHRLKEKK